MLTVHAQRLCYYSVHPLQAGRCNKIYPQSRAILQRSSFSQSALIRQETEQPRYLRRKALYPTTSLNKSQKSPSGRQDNDTSSPRPTRNYRSRHFDSAREVQVKSEIRLLEPHVLSARLKKLCDAKQIDAAVTMLKNSPLDAQNPPVWNTCIWECMKAQRFKLGYQLFVDMKRRGFSPTTRTFQTMFTGLSRIENWTSHSKQLSNAHSIYDSFQRYMTALKKHSSDSPELSIDPLAGYIKILGDAGCHQEIFDVYYAMDSEGPLAPNHFIYTAMFQALAKKQTIFNSQSSTEIQTKNAANAKLLWTQMQKALQKSPTFQVDAILVTAALTALSRGRLTDQMFAFTIIRDYYGLTAPEDPPCKATIPLAPQSLAVILMLCNNSRKYSFCDHFLQQIKKRPEALGNASILDRAHMEEVLKARLALAQPGTAYYCLEILEWMLRQEIIGQNGPKIRPAITTFNLVLAACWRDGDWKSATRVFSLMTGYRSHDFMDGSVASAPRPDQRGAGRNLIPNPETLSTIVRTALASRDRANVRQCLRIVDYMGANHFFIPTEKTEDVNKASKNKRFFISKLASAILDAVQYVSEGSGRGRVPQEEVRWKDLEIHARNIQTRNDLPTSPVGLMSDRQVLRR